MRFFFDANFPAGLARAVKEVTANRAIEVITHDDWFPEGTKDVKWIADVAGRVPKPFVIGGDGAILKHPAEAVALRESDLTYFILVDRFANLGVYQQASTFFKAWPEILKEAGQTKVPTVFEITVNGRVEIKYATAQVPLKKVALK